MASRQLTRVDHRCISLVRGMFIHTADENYLGARSAFFERRDFDFWWLTLHAVEKYLKAQLLMNGHSASKANHNIETLLGRVKSIDPRLSVPQFQRPKIAGAPAMFEEHASFVSRLNTYGSAPNRYAAYSYTLSDIDIFQADHLVFWARRHSRVLRQSIGDGTEIDWISELAANPHLWVHHDGSPLEKIAAGDMRSGLSRTFARSNVAFFPHRRHRHSKRRGSYIRNGPFYNLLEALKSSLPDTESRAEARAVLQWSLENIYLPKDDKEHLAAVLASYP